MDRLSSRWLLLIALAAFSVRVAVRMWSGAADFWEHGYTFYFDLAQRLAAGGGFALADGTPTALRVPLYPLFVAAVTAGQRRFFTLVLAQSIVGAGTVVCGGLLAAELFGSAAGLTAGALLSVYPYYVVHDTALQETSLSTFLTALAVLLLVRARRSMSAGTAGMAGLVLAGSALTRATIAPFALLAPVWLVVVGEGTRSRRLRAAALCAGVFGLGLTPWLLRSYRITGLPALGTEAGYILWRGNNPYTFSHYPVGSIDLSTSVAFDAFSEAEKTDLSALDSDASVNRWFLNKGLAFIEAHPYLSLSNGLCKIRAAFSWLPSPRRSFWPTVVHVLSYGPLMTLGFVGLLTNWRSWREHSLIYLLIGCFMIVTAVFLGHTSHRAFLDVYLIAFAAAVAVRWMPKTPQSA